MIFEKQDKENKDIVFVYTTCSNMTEAKTIGFISVNEKLAISADYWLINSIYPWKNVIQEIDQYMLLLVTKESLCDKLIKLIEDKHSYSVPVIIKSDISLANQPYLFWIENILTSKEKYVTEEEYQKGKTEKEKGYVQEKLK
jgi:periplasmic divalent cation tolerance protein